MITIIDYGLGNIKAFMNVYKALGLQVKIANTSQDLEGASKLILPGVGAFDHAMNLLNASGMREGLDKLVLHENIPVLGICVGMQILGNSSEEGEQPGLGWINGTVKKFDIAANKQHSMLPHMGWNDVMPDRNFALFKDVDDHARFYFLHSYFFQCNDESNCIARTDYGGEFTCAINRDKIYGVQFHPEKSHQWGVQLLKNFAII